MRTLSFLTESGKRTLARTGGVRWNAVIASLLLMGSLALGTQAESPWASQTGLTEAQLADRLDHWAQPGYQLIPLCVSGYEEAGQPRYAALWGAREDDDARTVLVGKTAAELTSANALQQTLGRRLVWLTGFSSGGVDYYNAIYRHTGGARQVLRLGDSLATHQSADASWSGNGYYLDNVCVFRSGLQVRYGAWWNEGALAPQMAVSYGLSAADYQAEFNLRAGQWRLHQVCGYAAPVGNEDRFTVIWRRPARSVDWAAYHGLAKLNYFATQGNQTQTGRRPLLQQAWAGSGSEIRFNGIWVENGGIAGKWSGPFERDIAEHMRTNGVPGFTVAISRQGRLVYARGFGYANQETGELAGPEHRFRIASVSKPVCAVSVLHALERSRTRSLASTLFGTGSIFGSDYGTGPYSARETSITVRHVLNHTAGWPDDGRLWWDTFPSYGSEHAPVISYQLNSVAQIADPGRVGRYSNLGFVIAARVVEKLTGRTYEDYAVNDVLAACGIDGVTRMAVGEREATARQFQEAAYYPHPTFDADPYLIDPRRMDGSTAWIAKPADLLLLARRIDGTSAHTDILRAESIEDMKTRGTPDSSSGYDFRKYGLGWGADQANAPTQWGHNGGMAGTKANFIVRNDGVSYAWMANTPAGEFDAIVQDWIGQLNAAQAWPDIDLSSSAHPSYDAWAAANFSALDRGQPGLRVSYFGPDADPDGDRLPNAGEAYHGLDPLSADEAPFTVTRVGSSMRVRWQRVVAEQGVIASVQTSSDLVHWLYPLNLSITDRPDLISAVGKRQQEVLVPLDGQVRFVRLVYRTH